MEIGTCSCEKGRNESPCSHQAAIVFHYHTESLNFVSTSQRQEIAYYWVYMKNIIALKWYFTGSCWDTFRVKALDDSVDNESVTEILDQTRKEELIGKIDSFADIMKQYWDFNYPQLIPDLVRLSTLQASVRLASALHTFGSQPRIGVTQIINWSTGYSIRGVEAIQAGWPQNT